MTTKAIPTQAADPMLAMMHRMSHAVAARVMAFALVIALFIGAVYKDERGDIKTNIGAVVGGVLTIVVGLVLSNVILTQAAQAGSSSAIGSFSGAQALNDLIPLIYYAVVVLIGVGLMGVGALGFKNQS